MLFPLLFCVRRFAKLWAVPVLLGMLLGAIANVGYAVISLQQSVASCAATSTSPESSFQLVGAEQGLGPKPLEEVTFEGGVKLQEIINGCAYNPLPLPLRPAFPHPGLAVAALKPQCTNLPA